MRGKTTFDNIHVKNMTHVTELELNTRAFAPPLVHIPFIPVGRTKECQECAKIFLQVGSSAVRFKNVPLTTESKISLRSRSCSPAIIGNLGTCLTVSIDLDQIVAFLRPFKPNSDYPQCMFVYFVVFGMPSSFGVLHHQTLHGLSVC